MHRWSSVVTTTEWRKQILTLWCGAEFRHIIRLTRGMFDLPPRQRDCVFAGMRDED
jgi:hypothetical protein